MENLIVVSDVASEAVFKKLEKSYNGTEFCANYFASDQFLLPIIGAQVGDSILCHFSPFLFSDHLTNCNKLERVREVINHLEQFQAKYSGLVVINTVFDPEHSYSREQLISKRIDTERINSEIIKFAKDKNNVLLIDLDRHISLLGAEANLNKRNYDIMKMPYSKSLSASIREAYSFHFQAFFKPKKKLVIVDADNTLWGGVIGEDGIDGIKIGQEYPGSVFWEFQSNLKTLKNNGTILCLASKNNIEDVLEVFKSRSMPLDQDDFVICKANWLPKSENISDLLKELNLGEAAAVFIDDNPFEIGEVSSALPELECLKFDYTDPKYSDFIFRGNSSYYSHFLSKEDLRKSASYKEEQQRRKMQVTARSQDEYIASLELVVETQKNNKSLIGRAAQMTQKTNQFNLTTRRYTEVQLEEFMKSECVLTFGAKDKYGDLGVIGLVILVGDRIDTLLLSCRAFGRRIERKMLSEAISHTKSKVLKASFIQTSKNQVARGFLADNGFVVTYEDRERLEFELTL
jgi:FkbH-like protein